MWTRHDWALMGVAAFATFGLSVALFLPRVVTADGDAGVTTAVPIPTLHLATCDVVAQLAPSDSPPESRQGILQMKAGAQPKLLFIIQNNTSAATTADFTAVISVSNIRSRLSRIVTFSPPVWTDSFSVNLKPSEQRTIDIPANFTLDAGSTARLAVVETAAVPPASKAVTDPRGNLTFINAKPGPTTNVPAIVLLSLSAPAAPIMTRAPSIAPPTPAPKSSAAAVTLNGTDLP